MVVHLIHFLVGGGIVTSYVSFTGHGVGPLLISFGGSSSATEVNFTQQQFGQLLGLDLKCSASLLGSAAIENLAFEVQPNSHSQQSGGSVPWFPCKRCAQGSRTFSSQDSHSSAVVFGGGSWTGLR